MDKLGTALVGPLAQSADLTVRGAVFRTVAVPESLAAPGQTVGVGLLGIDLAGHQCTGLLLATPNLLRTETDGQDEHLHTIGPLAERLERVRVEVRPVLAAGRVTLADLAELAPGAVLRLDVAVDAPIELRVAGRSCFRGTIARDADGTRFRVDWRRGHQTAQQSQPSQEARR
jgi:flagellar motor switch/type III secretory pathway protein FliN